jgi:hypothetical protein
MNKTLLTSALLAAFAMTACDKPATVVTVPVPVAVPGPAGPTGATGGTGATGDAGKPGEGTSTTVIVMPAASAASN